MPRIKITDLPESQKITPQELRTIYGGPNRRAHDHIGNFTYMIDLNNIGSELLASDENKLL